ncbi:MAG: hypothetical protein ACPLZG_09420 [Thermoproteota archaeon]|jgi:hypothetical protein
MERSTVQVPPFIILVDEIPVTIYEVYKSVLVSGDVFYHAVIEINYKGIRSKRYTIDAKDYNSLINKVKVEIDKIKFIEYSFGINEVRRLLS